MGGANHIHEFLAPVLGGGAEPAKAHAGISILSQAWASGGEAGGHSAALEFLMMAGLRRHRPHRDRDRLSLLCEESGPPKQLAEKRKGLYTLVFNKYYVDELYEILFVNSLKRLGTGLWKGFDEFIIDGTVNGIAYLVGWISSVMRKIQTGFVQNYAFSMVIGGVILAVYYIVRAIFLLMSIPFTELSRILVCNREMVASKRSHVHALSWEFPSYRCLIFFPSGGRRHPPVHQQGESRTP